VPGVVFDNTKSDVRRLRNVSAAPVRVSPLIAATGSGLSVVRTGGNTVNHVAGVRSPTCT